MNLDNGILATSLISAACNLWPMFYHKSVPLTFGMSNLDAVTKPKTISKIGGIFAALAAALAVAKYYFPTA